MKKMKSFLAPIAILAVLLPACKKDEPVEPEIPNEEEVITTLIYTLTPVGGGDAVVFSFEDLDGDGGDDPVIVNGTLSENTSYNAELELLNETEMPADDITLEIVEEAEEHQFFFDSDATGVTIAYDDMDSDGNPIGLATIFSTTDAGTGELTIVLRHEPNKSASGVSDGDITNAGGETDIEVSFDLNVE